MKCKLASKDELGKWKSKRIFLEEGKNMYKGSE